jgi:hypothetical protein
VYAWDCSYCGGGSQPRASPSGTFAVFCAGARLDQFGLKDANERAANGASVRFGTKCCRCRICIPQIGTKRPPKERAPRIPWLKDVC